MPGEYISREAFRRRVDEIIKTNHLRPDYVWFTPNGVKVLALEIPSADAVRVRHGRFLGTEFEGYADGRPVYYEWQCSACGCIFEDEEPTFRFCPWCGAKMDLPEPPKDEAPTGPYDLLYEEGGPDA